MIIKQAFLIILLFCTNIIWSQSSSLNFSINWSAPYNILQNDESIFIPKCESCNQLNGIPFYSKRLTADYNGIPKFHVTHFSTTALSSQEQQFLQRFSDAVPSMPTFWVQLISERGNKHYIVSGVPFVKENGQLKKITAVSGTVTVSAFPFKAKSFATTSVLNDPNIKWYKIRVSQDGIYKIDRNFLASIGVDVNSVNPQHLNIYGNGFGILPVKNSTYRPDDLVKNPIFVSGEQDGHFDNGDYILFHAFGPQLWSYDKDGIYRRQINPYTKYAYYFIAVSSTDTPLRITSEDFSNLTPNANISTYDYSVIHELEQRNLSASGQRFYGEVFDTDLSQNFSFSIPDIVNQPTPLYVALAAKNQFGGSNFKIYYNNNLLSTASISALTEQEQFPRKEIKTSFTPSGTTANIRIDLNRSNADVVGYLDKIEIFAKRNLRMFGNVMNFRTKENVGVGSVNRYTITNFPANAQVWDITNRTAPEIVVGTIAGGNQFQFNAPAESVREFVVFTPNGYLTPTFSEEVAQQNLHGLDYADILIVTNPKFNFYANKLADLHRNEGQTVNVVTTDQVYNEFSSGQPDPVAIRFFCKMFYDRAAGDVTKIPQNLILFGNGTYDPRMIMETDPSYVLAYEALGSPYQEYPMTNFTTDDFFVMLADNDSIEPTNLLDMGVGRMIASSTNDAQIMLDKIQAYTTNSHNGKTTFGDWRLKYSLVADDEDTFVEDDCERLYDSTVVKHPEMNARKIYADAYPREITAGGIRFPQMESDINRAVNEGSLLLTYVGHGGNQGAGQERFITIPQINAWNNTDMLNVFVSATCDFTRPDDPKVVSAGQSMLLNPNGGSVSMMTTTRAILYSTNSDISKNFYENIFERDANFKPLTLGEIFRRTKNGAYASDNKRSFMVIGDPALRLDLPDVKIVTDSLNGKLITDPTIDTLKALSEITISGHVTDANNNFLSSFNGVIVPSVFDKPKLNKTLGLSEKTSVLDFYTQTNALYRGNVTVSNGKFRFTFIVPKDIDYNYGKGKISYYADNKQIDAGGYNSLITVGGINPNGVTDKEPPVIQAWLNDESFVNGGLTSENPILIAKLSDNLGINAVGNGVGHDITMILDNDDANPIILNNYYIADLDSYKSGKINYQMNGIRDGKHTLKIKAWDVNNNSAEYVLDFVVAKKQKLALDHVLNYPNPFTTSTDFYFEHNQFDELLETQIQIFTITGKLVKTINADVQTSGFRSQGIHWDGRDDFGDQLARGVYIYTLTVTNSAGDKASKTDKIVLLK